MKGWVGLVGWPTVDGLPTYSVHPSATGRAQDSQSLPARDRRSTAEPCSQPLCHCYNVVVVEHETSSRRCEIQSTRVSRSTASQVYWSVFHSLAACIQGLSQISSFLTRMYAIWCCRWLFTYSNWWQFEELEIDVIWWRKGYYKVH